MTITGNDPNALFRAAEAAYAQGRPADALPLLNRVSTLAGPHGAVLHLTALVFEQLGQFDEAVLSYERARKADRDNPEIVNNLGTLLEQLGRVADAVQAYGAAIKRAPQWIDPLINRALALHRMGDIMAARADFSSALARAPRNARALAGLAALERAEDNLEAAALAYDKALAVAPGFALALHGRARVAMERGEPEAPSLFRAAYQTLPDNRDVLMGLAETLDAAGDPEGRALLSAAALREPHWLAAHEMLARLKAEAGERDITASYDAAIAAQPGTIELHQSLWRTLVRADDYSAALKAVRAARHLFAGSADIVLEEATIASEAGDTDGATRLLDTLPASPARDTVAARLALRLGDAEKAARLLEGVVKEYPSNVVAWAHLDVAWRLTNDLRHDWLSGQPGLVAYRETGLDGASLAAIVEMLRTIHRARGAPIGQSVRGGTQTRGRLFARTEPAIGVLREAIVSVVEQHCAALPAFDAAHPLLKHRPHRLKFDGSWSIRLTDGGGHINHVHPQGLMSSALHLIAPSGDAEDQGALILGAPPVELGLDLEPLQTIAPKPGHLALFPSYLFHGTRTFAAGERLTVAFDLVPA